MARFRRRMASVRSRNFAGIGKKVSLTSGATSYGYEKIARSGVSWPNLYAVTFSQGGNPWQLETTAAASVDRIIDLCNLNQDKSSSLATGGLAIPASTVSPWLRQQVRPYTQGYPYAWDVSIRWHVQNQDVGKYGMFMYCYPVLYVDASIYGPAIPTTIASLKLTEGIKYQRITTHGTPSNAAWSTQYMRMHVNLKRLITKYGLPDYNVNLCTPFTGFVDGASTSDYKTGIAAGQTQVRLHVGIISIGSFINGLNHYWTADVVNHYLFTTPQQTPLT